MQPYASPFYFLILGILLVPLIIAHSYKKRWMGYQVVITIFFLWLTFGGSMSLWPLLGFGFFETILIKIYERYRVGENSKNSMSAFVVTLLLSIAPLFIVKVTPLIDSSHPASIIGFLGISYVTFKTVSTIIELRDGLIKEVSVKEFVYFIYFYPTISSGPIDRFRRFRKDLNEPLHTQKYAELVRKGILYIFLGFLYNFIIGYEIDNLVLHQAALHAVTHPNFASMLITMYSYGLYLFFNFAGYSLFAVGVSYIMGYDIPINFNKPFIAKNIHDFWNRWHMSLSFWFRDFIFMRFVKWLMKKRWFKKTATVSNIGYLFNMGLMGCWHGLTPYYIIYGLYHACLMIIFDSWNRFKKKHKIKIPDTKLTRALSIFITFNAVFVGFLIFSGVPYTALLYALHVRVILPNF